MAALAQSLGNLGGFRLASIAGIGIGLIGFFIFIVTRITGPSGMELLYSGLDPAESGKIVARLESQGVPFTLKSGGSQVFVPEDRVMQLRLSLAESGAVSDGAVGYEIFDDSDTMGTTNFVQNINRVRALEGELARTIKTISSIKRARVHLVLPQRQLFSREKTQPSASVTLKLTSRFTQAQVRAVQSLVSASVPGLISSRISVVDDKGNLLARIEEKTTDGTTPANDADELRRNFEMRLARTIEELLTNSVGPGNVRAEVNAEMDFDRVTTNSETYDPEGQVVRSTQTIEENSNASESTSEDAVTVAKDIPSGDQQSENGPKSNSKSSRTEETVNFEISKTVKNHVQESGTVKRLSVAVLIDGTYNKAKDGTKTYVPRSAEEMAQLGKLVKSAVGFNEGRGDVVDVVNLQFTVSAEGFAEEEIESLFGLDKRDYFRMAEIGVLSVVAILVILMVVRPLLMRVLDALPPPLTAEEREAAMLTDQRAAAAAAGVPGAAPGGESAISAAAGYTPESAPTEADSESMINLQQIEGRVKASSLKKVGEIIDKHPEETVSIIRNWMFEDTKSAGAG